MTNIELLVIAETLKEFEGMMSWQRTKIYTDHKDPNQDDLGSTLNRVYQWRLLLKDYGPEIMHIKGIQNTVADAISRLDFGPVMDDTTNFMTFKKCWCHYTMHATSAESTHDHQIQINMCSPIAAKKMLFSH